MLERDSTYDGIRFIQHTYSTALCKLYPPNNCDISCIVYSAFPQRISYQLNLPVYKMYLLGLAPACENQTRARVRVILACRAYATSVHDVRLPVLSVK